jgi:LEA14-like dessication related protein
MKRRSFPAPRGRPRQWAQVFVLLVLGVVLGGCALFYRSPQVQIADVRVVQLGFTSGTAEVKLDVTNPNRFGLEVRELAYLLEVAEREDLWTELARGQSSERVRIGRRSTREVTLAVPFQYRGAGSALRAWWETGEIRYRVRGEIKARAPTRTIDLPFRAEGTVVP